MRILLIGSAHTWRVERAIERALRRAGHTTLLLDDRQLKRLMGHRLTQRWVAARAARFRPDFVFLAKCHALELETVDRLLRERPNAMWYHDPQWFREIDRPDIAHIAAVARLAQTFFVSGFELEWRAHGLRALFLPSAADAAITPVPPDSRYAADLVFIGTGYDEERAARLINLAQDHEVRVWGLGWEKWRNHLKWAGRPVEGREFSAVCSSAKITLGINHLEATGEHGGGYTSDRTWTTILAGAFYLGEATPGVDQLLSDGRHCAWYQTAKECQTQIQRYLADSAARERVRLEGNAFVRQYHTYDARIPSLLSGTRFVNPLSR